VRVPEPGQHPVNDVLQPLLILLSGLGGLSLVLSGFLVINTISALMTQQTRQIGMMKAIGARQGQIVRLYIVTVLAYGSLALLVAIPIGALGAYVFTSMMADFFNFDLTRFTIPPSVLATQVAIGLLVPLIVSLYPIITGTRITVREAISDYGVGKGRFGTNIIDRLLQNVRGMSRPLIISLRNTFRRKTRLSLTLLTLTLAGATFITIFSIRDSLLLTLDDALQYWNYQIGITFEQNYRIQEIERIASQVPDVMEIESWGFNSVRRLRPDGEDGDSIFLIALPAETNMLKPILLEGRWLEPADTNAVVINTELVDDEPDVKIGDSVILKLGNRKVTWQVVGLVQGILAGPFAYANYPYYAKVANNVNKASVTQINTNSMDGDVHAKISEQLEKEFTDAGFKIVRVDTVANIRETIKSRFDFLVSFLLAMAVVMAVVGGLGLTGTMSINVLERVREIGVMRAIGASDMAVLRLIITEGIIIGMLSWAIGTVVAFPLSKLISYQVGMQLFKSPLSFAFSINGIIIWLIVAVVLASFASFLPARGASQLTVREVLAYE
jgi:putative ABC transport system permease protein